MLAPPEILLKIMVHLDYKELIRLGSCSKALWNIHKEPKLWKRLNEQYSVEGTTREHFKGFCIKYGHWISIYPQMMGSIRKLVEFMDKNELKDMKDSFKAPAAIEILTGQSPLTSLGQLALFYHLFSQGQDEDSPPLFGTCTVDEVIYPMWLHTYYGFLGRFAKRGIVQFTGDAYIRGQSCHTIRSNLVWFKGGGYYYPRGMFLDFFESFVSDLEGGRYDIVDGHISSFPNYGLGVAQSKATTDIVVSVSTMPLPSEDSLYARRFRVMVNRKLFSPTATIEFQLGTATITRTLAPMNDYIDTCTFGYKPILCFIRDTDQPDISIEMPIVELETHIRQSP